MREDKRIADRVVRRNQRTLEPVPFAGQHPTRILWWISFRGNAGAPRITSYNGKPSKAALQRLIQLSTNPQARTISFYEVDRNNVLSAMHCDARQFIVSGATAYDFWRLYHPYHTIGNGIQWIASRWWIKRIKTVCGVRPIYAPVEKLEMETHLKPYKNYVNTLRWPNGRA